MAKKPGGDFLSQLKGLGFDVSEGEKEQEEKRKKEQNKYNNYTGNRDSRERGDKNQNDRRNNAGGGKNGDGQPDNRYVGAPYNFVSQWDTVIGLPKEAQVPHNALEEELISGEISYEIRAESDILVGDGEKEKHFTINPYGKLAIPGSSVRGLIRSNVQVLGMSSIADDVEDYSLLYREVATPASRPNKKIYEDILGAGQISVNGKPVSVLKNVKAGYLVKEGSKYVIYRTKVDQINQTLGAMNYYVLSERTIAKDKARTDYPFYWNHREYTQHRLENGFKPEEQRNGRIQYKGDKNRNYRPYYASVSYAVQGEKTVIYVGEADGKVSVKTSRQQVSVLKGVAIGTGAMMNKKCHYIIPEIDRNKPKITLADADVRAFQIDYTQKENQLKGLTKEGYRFFNLPESGEEKPVFYIETDDGRTYFGFTPRLRLFYKHTIKEGLSSSQLDTEFDYAKSMFGYAGERDAYKSKVSFSDAVVIDTASSSDMVQLILGEPKASSYNDYLETDDQGRATTYNTEEKGEAAFKLRGVKQYWLRDELMESKPGSNENVASKMYPVSKGAIFTGKVRFHNLTAAEYGLLLWSLCLKEKSNMQIGHAKPYGYGRIKLTVTGIRELDCRKAYTGDLFEIDPMREIPADSMKKYIEEKVDEYKKTAANQLRALGVTPPEIEKQDSIREFFAMKDSTNMPNADLIRYMDINNKEYQNRKPLGTVSQVLNKPL